MQSEFMLNSNEINFEINHLSLSLSLLYSSGLEIRCLLPNVSCLKIHNIHDTKLKSKTPITKESHTLPAESTWPNQSVCDAKIYIG